MKGHACRSCPTQPLFDHPQPRRSRPTRRRFWSTAKSDSEAWSGSTSCHPSGKSSAQVSLCRVRIWLTTPLTPRVWSTIPRLPPRRGGSSAPAVARLPLHDRVAACVVGQGFFVIRDAAKLAPVEKTGRFAEEIPRMLRDLREDNVALRPVSLCLQDAAESGTTRNLSSSVTQRRGRAFLMAVVRGSLIAIGSRVVVSSTTHRRPGLGRVLVLCWTARRASSMCASSLAPLVLIS